MRDSKDDFHCPLCGCRLLWFPVSHIFLCEGCEQSFNEKAEAYLRHQTKSPVGNSAAMREALIACFDFIMRLDRAFNPFMQNLLENAIAKATAALSAPQRKCDVGTVEEQESRYERFCDSHKWVDDEGANGCLSDCPLYNASECSLHWAQMPHETEEGGAK